MMLLPGQRMKEEVKQRLQRTETWVQGFFILFFVFVSGVVESLIIMIMFFQYVSILVTGKTNTHLLRLGKYLAAYVYQIVLYLTFNTGQRPFPFTIWPTEASDKEGSKT
ncbi:MAG TPA: DUF4389 domain-containing protein [Nitrosomonas sp.]|nr:DUF4389 domain-containing protein [Nitrosomonas sp.]HMV12337.1 DUF4389 domain-containing protein [Nitrosomonas sp.]HMW21316.1 DUF4389 domain-containing protein [Nitrosomonas sp.]HMW69124.1 DUF4389 domain-containing protein [Nitrosomonas sp.]HMY62055.1 DUF4389 domain-containing protein [Nitrosomonas sp.]